MNSTLTTTTNWKRNTIIFLIGQSITLFGSMLSSYAIQWHILLTSQSGIAMTLFTITSTLPMFFISPFAGVWADRYSKKLLINIADAVIAMVTLLMALLFSVGFKYIALLLICTAVRGFGQGIQTPAVNSFLPELVPEEKLMRVNGINSSIQSVTMFISPVVGGALIAMFPVESVLFIDVITAVIGITILLFFVKTPLKEKIPKETNAWSDISEGLRYIKNHPFIRKFIMINVLFNLFYTPAAVLTPLQTVRDFGEEKWRLVAIELAFLIGMTLGGLLISVWGGFKNKSHTIALSTAIAGTSFIALGLVNNFPLYLFFMVIGGFTISTANTPLLTIMQIKIEAEYMGRVFSIFSMISALVMPIGMVLWGPLADIVRINWLLFISGAGVISISIIIMLNKVLREAGLP